MDLEKYFNPKDITGRFQKAIARETAETLLTFCKQETEFMQAVEQSGKTYQQCLDTVTQNVGSSLSDQEAYTKAAQFYFPGAKVHFFPLIDLVGDAEAPEQKAGTLTDAFDNLADW